MFYRWKTFRNRLPNNAGTQMSSGCHVWNCRLWCLPLLDFSLSLVGLPLLSHSSILECQCLLCVAIYLNYATSFLNYGGSVFMCL